MVRLNKRKGAARSSALMEQVASQSCTAYTSIPINDGKTCNTCDLQSNPGRLLAACHGVQKYLFLVRS